MTQGNQRPLRSREERARAARSEEFPEEDPAGPEPAGDVEQLRRAAEAQGFSLARERRPSGVRPAVEEGRVRVACRVSVEVRRAMELARWELNLTFSDIIERGVVLFLDSQGLRVEGVDPPGR